ncbi:unnamed protein product [Parnassius mnemosyne]|uniref:Cytadhesion n=1 Tax=Parnassius mnemosyne TaxID=213953 RepID=A0AAV1KLA2_9NEOP
MEQPMAAERQTVVINPIPTEMLRLIPLFNGDKRQLNLFLRKCEYVIRRYRGDEEQNLYVYHSITSRLTDNAASLLSEREDVVSWSQLKDLLTQHFGDPRSEECISIELESLKIKSGENFQDFCNRIQSIRSLLISKVNISDDSNLKSAKLAIYNNTALNVFLYNLPENMVRIVRLKRPATLEDALSIVLEEVNFHDQYNMRNRVHGSSGLALRQPQTSVPIQGFKFGSAPHTVMQPYGYKPVFPNNITPKFNFGIPNQSQFKMPQSGFRPQPMQQIGYRPPQFGYRPQLGQQPQQFSYRPQLGPQPQQFGYRPQLGFQPHHFGQRPQQQFGHMPTTQFGYRPPQFGYRPQLGQQPQQFSYRPQLGPQPQQFGYRPQLGFQPHHFGQRPQQQFGHMPTTQFGNKPQTQKPNFQETDVSMRTAPPRPQPGFRLNELTLRENDGQYNEYYDTDEYVEQYDNEFTPSPEETVDETTYDEFADETQPQTLENFHMKASIGDKKS